MTSAVDPLPEVMREAQMQGDIAEPAALLAALAAVENPIRALSDHDQANALFAAFDSEFGFIQHARTTRNRLQPVEQSRWASLVRWLVRELTRWQRAEDPANRKLVAIFVVAQASEWENGLWKWMPIEIGNNSDLIQYLKNLISSFSAIFTARGGVAEPIWEREAVEKFNVADAEGDWVNIGISVVAFEHQIFPSTLQIQSIRCLHRCGMDHLVNALANLRQTAVAMQAASTLSVDQCLRLAGASNNPYVQFGCIYETLSGRQAAPQFVPEEQRLLAALLLKVAEDEPRWLAWMHVFNAYPIRYPGLQVSLGHALANVPEAAIGAYVNAIVLRAKPAKPDAGRRNVAECLRAFRAKATPDRRALLWSRAHERWSAWRFDQANADTHLFAINWSDLDYAAVAFACECMSDADRTKVMNTVRDELQVLEDRWHTSVTDIVTAWNRLLSQFQPYAHASHAIITGEDWLPETKTYLPFDPSTNEYLAMKYRLV